MKTLVCSLLAFAATTVVSADAQVVSGVEVIQYSEGSGTSASLRDPAAALGIPNPVVPGFSGPSGDEALNPFAPHYTGANIVQIGVGGALTLRLDYFVTLNDTPGVLELGVVENIFLTDTTGSGQNGNPAGAFGSDSAEVEVSADGTNFFSLGMQDFTLPANYWTDAPTRGATGSIAADFGEPFGGAVSDFDGLNWSDTLSELDGSGGGTWLDVPTSLGISEIGWVRFSGVSTGTLEVDSVLGNGSLRATPTPEPGTALLLLLSGGLTLLCGSRQRANRELS